ncbi:MAG: hypothetical protein A7315_09805 [Candidatus Altiarchaeales archaeon WOR_SM1_79]|nr:MAG: hypothetical protein A7315_09805 [Candidatus Altiarchaeales archaeon WOR_SM1_79]
MGDILWCITGAGQFLIESCDFIKKLSKEHKVTIALSDAGYEVAGMYNRVKEIKDEAFEVILEKDQGASAPLCGRVGRGRYDLVVVAPCTANSIAKIAYGIADSLVTNVVAQAGKGKVPVCLLPTDMEKIQKTMVPGGEEVEIHCRDIDIENVKKAAEIEGIYVIKKLDDLGEIIQKYN